MHALGRFSQTLVLLMVGLSFVLHGVSLLGLAGPTAHIDNAQLAHWRAAVFLVLGGGLLATALFALLNKLKEKAA